MNNPGRAGDMAIIDIPDQPYFRIGQAAKLLGLEPYVLRYWETQFPQINPTRAPSRQRLYRRRDLELMALIQDLLHSQGFTLAGAGRRLEEMAREGEGASSAPGAPAASSAPGVPAAGSRPSPDKEQVVAELKDILKMMDLP